MSSHERDESTTEELREGEDDLGDKASREAADAKEGAKSVGDRVTDAVEDVIPGDSDHDGH